MKNYLKGAIALATTIIMLIFLMLQSHWYLNGSRNTLMQLKGAREIRKRSYELMEQGLLANSQTVEVIDAFSETWKTFLGKSTDQNRVLNDMVELSFCNTVAVSEKTAQRLKINEGGVVKEAVLISLKVVGKFERIYAWLGAVEEAYPHAKINELELMAENTNAALTLGLQIPVMI